MEPNEIVKQLRLCSQNLIAHQFGNEFADFISESADCIERLQAELTTLRKELTSLAIESVEREKSLARLEAEVMVAAERTRGTCTTTGHPCCGCAPVCGDERRE